MRLSRRTFFSLAGAGLTVGAYGGAAAAMPPAAREGLSALLAGNARFVAGTPHCGPLTALRAQLVDGQQPFAAILSCSDSRVPVETVFDQEPGNVFGVRLAGNFLTDEGLGSLEYGVGVLKASLILVLGHSSCGAVKAAMEYVKTGEAPPEHIALLAKAIAPAAKASKAQTGDWLTDATLQNVRENVAALTARSHMLAAAVKGGKLHVAGGIYDLASGKVTALT